MAFVPTPNAVRVVISYEQGTMGFSNVFHFTRSSFGQAEMEALAAAIDETVHDDHMPSISSGVNYLRTTVYDIRTADGPIAVDSTGSGAGLASGGTAPINCAVVLTLRTAARGRTGRGRVYVTGMSDDELSVSTWSVNAGTVATNYMTNIRTAASAAGWTHVIRSTQVDGVALNPAVTRQVTGFDVRSRITGSQRRRVDRI